MKINQTLAVAAIVTASAVAGYYILDSERPTPVMHEHGESADHAHAEGHAGTEHHGEKEAAEGPHGGRLFTDDDYGVEITIHEAGVEPRFRIYTYLSGKPLPPSASKITIDLLRLGQPLQNFTFVPENDYLRSDAVVEEPHSFTVNIRAQYEGRTRSFSYSQEEERTRMSDEQLRTSGVEVKRAGPARIRSTLHLLGEIRFNQDRQVHVVPRLAGVVESVEANAGDVVRKGQLLAVISSQTLAEQRAELLAAQKRLALAHRTYEREQRLWQDKISAEQDYLQARNSLQEAQIAVDSAQQRLRALGGTPVTDGELTRYEILAPIDGTVTAKDISVGESLKEDADIFTISDLSTVWAEMTVYAKDLNTVKTGQSATVRASAFDAAGTGTITYIGALVGEENRAATARVVLPNPEGIWRPGLPVDVEVTANEVEVPVAVVADAIQSVRDWSAVFVRYGEYFEARPLTLGRSDGRYIEVLKGLKAGEPYAARNSFLVKADIGKAGASHEH